MAVTYGVCGDGEDNKQTDGQTVRDLFPHSQCQSDHGDKNVNSRGELDQQWVKENLAQYY